MFIKPLIDLSYVTHNNESGIQKRKRLVPAVLLGLGSLAISYPITNWRNISNYLQRRISNYLQHRECSSETILTIDQTVSFLQGLDASLRGICQYTDFGNSNERGSTGGYYNHIISHDASPQGLIDLIVNCFSWDTQHGCPVRVVHEVYCGSENSKHFLVIDSPHREACCEFLVREHRL